MATRYDPTHVDRVNVTVCQNCMHSAPHRNLQPTWQTDRHNNLVEVPHPNYDPSEFHCTLPDCACVVVR